MSQPCLNIGVVALNARRGDGAGRVMLELTKTLASHGHSVCLYAREVDDELRASVTTYSRLPAMPGPQMLSEMAVFGVATRRLKRAGHDIVVMMGAIARPRHPYVVYAQFSLAGWMSTWEAKSRPGLYHRVHAGMGRSLERRIFGPAEGVISCSAAVVSELGLEMEDPERVVIVPNGVALSEFRSPDPATRAKARAELGAEGAWVVGFIGEYKTGRKGLDLLLEAAALAGHVEHVVIAGAGPTATVAQQAGRLGLAGRVHQLGVVPAPRVLEVADAVVVPSRYEPFSLVALEAAATGLPVVLPRTVGASAFLGDGALVLESLDAPSIRAALDSLRSDPDRARTIGEAGRRMASELDWAVTSQQAAVFVEAVASRSVRPT